MKQEEILEGNKLIAEFMGAKWEFQKEIYNDYGWKFEEERYKHISMWHNTTGLQYHESWDWLMPVISKCVSVGLWSSEETNAVHDGLLNQNIEQCYIGCVEFIKWYDNQKGKS